jgi:hypothetical protein
MEMRGKLQEPAALPPRKEKITGTHWIGGCVDRNAVLDAMERRKSPVPPMNRTPVTKPVTRRYCD